MEPFVNFIANLDPSVPTGAEAKSLGDDYIRDIKRAMKNTFAGFEGAVIATGVDGGVVNAYTLSPSTPLLEYSPRMLAVFTPNATNTGSCTLNISGLGITALTRIDGNPLDAGEIAAGRPVVAVREGSSFRLLTITKQYVDQLVISGTVPGVNVATNAGKFFSTDGANGVWRDINLTPPQGGATIDKGASSTATQVFNRADGEGQTLTATGNFSFSAAGFAAGRIDGMLIRAINWGAFAPASTGITWLKSDGTETTTFAAAGYTLKSSGASLLAIFTYGDGTIYGKAA